MSPFRPRAHRPRRRQDWRGKRHQAARRTKPSESASAFSRTPWSSPRRPGQKARIRPRVERPGNSRVSSRHAKGTSCGVSRSTRSRRQPVASRGPAPEESHQLPRAAGCGSAARSPARHRAAGLLRAAIATIAGSPAASITAGCPLLAAAASCPPPLRIRVSAFSIASRRPTRVRDVVSILGMFVGLGRASGVPSSVPEADFRRRSGRLRESTRSREPRKVPHPQAISHWPTSPARSAEPEVRMQSLRARPHPLSRPWGRSRRERRCSRARAVAAASAGLKPTESGRLRFQESGIIRRSPGYGMTSAFVLHGALEPPRALVGVG